MTIDTTKLWTEIMLVLAAVSDAFHGQISAFIAAHPQGSMIAAVILAIYQKLQASPVVPAPPKP